MKNRLRLTTYMTSRDASQADPVTWIWPSMNSAATTGHWDIPHLRESPHINVLWHREPIVTIQGTCLWLLKCTTLLGRPSAVLQFNPVRNILIDVSLPIQVVWSVFDDQASIVRGFKIRYQAIGSNVVQFSGMLGSSTYSHEITRLHENTAYDVCVHVFTADQIQQQQPVSFDVSLLYYWLRLALTCPTPNSFDDLSHSCTAHSNTLFH